MVNELEGGWRISLYTNLPRTPSIGQSWTLADTYIGPSFLSGFEHQAIPDPTSGRVLVEAVTNYIQKDLTDKTGTMSTRTLR